MKLEVVLKWMLCYLVKKKMMMCLMYHLNLYVLLFLQVEAQQLLSLTPRGSKLKKIRLEEEAKINEEVDAYLYHLSKVDERHIICPLGWWKENCFKYPKVAIGTRKWLLVCATSTPSERVFLISDLIDTPKRSNLTGKAIFDQVLIHNDWKSLNPSLDRL